MSNQISLNSISPAIISLKQIASIELNDLAMDIRIILISGRYNIAKYEDPEVMNDDFMRIKDEWLNYGESGTKSSSCKNDNKKNEQLKRHLVRTTRSFGEKSKQHREAIKKITTELAENKAKYKATVVRVDEEFKHLKRMVKKLFSKVDISNVVYDRHLNKVITDECAAELLETIDNIYGGDNNE